MVARSEVAALMRAEHVPDPMPDWVALPTSRSPRWFIPRSPGIPTERSFLIHHPVTIRSRVAWGVARFLAAQGGLRPLRASAMLPREVWDPLADVIPKGGTLAVARANHPGRFFAIVVGPEGKLVAFVKVARDSSGAQALQRERRALETLGVLLPPPLMAPRVLEAADGLLMLEAVEWRRRGDPWRLPAEVAHALGRFFRATVSEGAGELGASHGDCTPWNLLRTERAWALVDWESAEEQVPAYLDPFHFLVQSRAELLRPTTRSIVQGLALKGWVGASIQAYAEGAGLDPREARTVFPEYLRYSAARISPSAPSRAIRIRKRLFHLVKQSPGGSG